MMYLVYYTTGSYEDWDKKNIAIFRKEFEAKEYVDKYNNLLKKLQEHNKRLEKKGWYDSERFGYDLFNKWDDIRENNGAQMEKLKVR